MTLSSYNLLKSLAEHPDLLPFEVAAGTVCGRDHTRAGRSSQDAMWWARGGRALVAVVCDGCGSSHHSELGARLGARLVVQSLLGPLVAGCSPAAPELWQRARRKVLAHLRVLGRAMGGRLSEVVADHFLFTVVGAVLTPTLTAVFSVGDGIYAINGEVVPLGPFPGNQPPYLGYDLLDGRPATELRLQLLRPTAEVDSLLLGSDGAIDLRDAEVALLPGSPNRVGALSQFWTEDLFFRNPDALRRRLALINRDAVSADWDERRLRRTAGLLRDDTTVIAIRRTREPAEEVEWAT